MRVYTRHLEVPADAIDDQGHVGNVAYIAWMQELAIEHSTAVGWPMARYREGGAGWVVRSHFVEYLRQAFAGDRLAMHTWVPEFSQRSAPRRYLFVREAAAELVARAETRWVFIDLVTGRRRPMPDDLLSAFTPVSDDAEVRRLVGLRERHP